MKINVLDKGYVKLIDVMATDATIAETARVSTQSNGKDNERLIRRLMRDTHTSPFEFAELHLEIKAPVFVFRQMFRHRTANINEQSLRYSESNCEFYLPTIERMQEQSVDNRQGSGEVLNSTKAVHCLNELRRASEDSEYHYKDLLDFGLTRELARNVLSFDLYASARWKIDLHNLFHFLKLRTDPHAQWEIQQYAIAIESIVKEKFPIAYNAWVDYVRDAVTFSLMEMEILRSYNYNIDVIETFEKPQYEHYRLTKSEYNQFLEKLK